MLAAVSDTVTNQGVVGAARIPDVHPAPPDAFLLVLDGLADPGNAGTILRTFRAAGGHYVLTTPGTTDLWSPKAVRAGMGAHFHLEIASAEPLPDRPLLLASAGAGVPYTEVDWSFSRGLIIGGEAHGAGPAAQRAQRVTIPMAPGVESLNAAAAAAVLLFAALQP